MIDKDLKNLEMSIAWPMSENKKWKYAKALLIMIQHGVTNTNESMAYTNGA